MAHSDNSQPDFDLEPRAAETAQIPEPPQKPPRTILWIAAIAGLIILLGSAAFMAVRLIGLRQSAIKPGSGLVTGLLPPNPGSNQAVNASVEIDITPAPELPATSPDVEGLFARRDGNSLFINQTNTGEVTIISMDGYSSGPEVEIVVTRDTRIFKDLTPLPEVNANGDVTQLEQKVALVDTPDEIKLGTALSVWGTMRGDRLIAQTILYADLHGPDN